MISPHYVIIIPGLGNGVKNHEWAVRDWWRFGLTPHVFDAKWKIEEPDFDKKLDSAVDLVDRLSKPGVKISLIGNSAGSSFAINIFGRRKANIHRVIVNCGRIRSGDWPWFTFSQATADSPSFKQSVLRAVEVERKLSMTDRSKILTVRPLFDEVVPPEAVPIHGAQNIIIPSVEHVASIALAMTVFRRKLVDFILS